MPYNKYVAGRKRITGPKCASGKNSAQCWRCAFVLSPQAVDLPEKNSCAYDGSMTGQTIYAYVGGNPLSSVDFKGLANGSAAQMWMKLPNNLSLANVDDPCVQKALNDTYGDFWGFVANLGNIQQYFPNMNDDSMSATQEALFVADEKLMMTKVPMALGKKMMFSGAAGPVKATGSRLLMVGGLTSGVIEVAGAVMTPFGSMATFVAQESCGCGKHK